ncbi:hypothetical protein NCS52_01119900 [Fusarium sp. LHS14.1]|nr:hypothetical protein NCS52_01119900 [Fusarium sp. LHS14.1]
MVSQNFVAALAAFSFFIGSSASPCRPNSSLSSAATTTSLAVIETGSTATGATSTTETASTDITSTTEAVSSTYVTSSAETSSTALSSTAYISTTTLATTTTTVAEPEVTLLVNGGFDVSPASYDPWTIFSGAALGGSIGTDDTTVQGGARSLAIRSASSSTVVVAQVLDKTLLKADKEYKFSLWGQVSSSTGCSDGIYIWIDANNLSQDVGPRVHASGADLAGGWRYMEGSYTFTEAMLSGDNSIRVVIQARCSNSQKAWVDTAQLVEA